MRRNDPSHAEKLAAFRANQTAAPAWLNDAAPPPFAPPPAAPAATPKQRKNWAEFLHEAKIAGFEIILDDWVEIDPPRNHDGQPVAGKAISDERLVILARPDGMVVVAHSAHHRRDLAEAMLYAQWDAVGQRHGLPPHALRYELADSREGRVCVIASDVGADIIGLSAALAASPALHSAWPLRADMVANYSLTAECDYHGGMGADIIRRARDVGLDRERRLPKWVRQMIGLPSDSIAPKPPRPYL